MDLKHTVIKRLHCICMPTVCIQVKLIKSNVNSETFVRILFLRIALKDIFMMLKFVTMA